MSTLGDIFNESNVSKEKLITIVNQLKDNPILAMTLLQELKLTPESNQKIMQVVLTQPQAIDEFAAELGISSKVVDSIKEKIKMPVT